MFAQTIGGALFISAAQNVFTNKLVDGIVKHVSGVSPQSVAQTGATSLAGSIDPGSLSAVLEVYNHALVSAFQIVIALSALSIVGALFVEWKSIKGRQIEMAGVG
jgi:hypothetical protein